MPIAWTISEISLVKISTSMTTSGGPGSCDEYAKRFPIEGPRPEQIRRIKARGLKPLEIDVADGDPAMLKELKSAALSSNCSSRVSAGDIELPE